MDNIADRISTLHDALVHQYSSTDSSNQARTSFTDTLQQYTSAVAMASTQAMCALLGIPTDDIHMLDLTSDQYRALVDSGMLGTYVDGKEELDD